METSTTLHRQELAALYGSYNDDFLLDMAEEDLSEVARSVLQNEITSRGLNEELNARLREHIASSNAQRLTVWSGRTMEEAATVLHTLELANLHAFLTTAPGSTPKERFRLSVAACDAETALEIVDRGLSESEVMELTNSFLQSAVLLPACVECGSEHVTYETSREGNCWLCEECRHSWEDVPSEQVSQPCPMPSESPHSSIGKSVTPAQKKWRSFMNRAVLAVVVITVIVVIASTAPKVWNTTQLVGLTLIIMGGLCWALGRWELGSSFTGRAEARDLVTTGIYSLIQNPIYLGGGLMTTGMILYLQRPWFLLLLLILIPSQMGRVRNERRILTDAFGDQYIEYRRGTWF